MLLSLIKNGKSLSNRRQPACRIVAVMWFLFLPVGASAEQDTVRHSVPASSAQAQPADESSVPTIRQSRPVWEFGVGGGYFSGYDYPASNDRNRRLIALPFFVYRSPLVRFGDGGIRAIAIENARVKLDLSIGGSLNASSEGNRARAGMPDLDFLFEIGPQLEVRLLDRPVESGGRLQARFTSEVRAVLVTDFKSVGGQGVVAEVGLGMNYRRIRGSAIDLFSAVDVTYANERLQDYFYQVDPQFATPARETFDAGGGYLETRLFTGIGFQPRKNIRVFLGAFTGLFDGARNQNSPLFETTTQTGFAAGFAWTIKTSKDTVDIIELGSVN